MTFGVLSVLARTVILVVLYFAAGKLGLAMATVHGSVSPVWPPTGLALVALLVLGIRFWPGITIGAFLFNITTPVSSQFITACGIAIGNTLEAVVGVWLLTRVVGFRPTLDRLRDVLALICCGAVLSTMASATVGVLTLCLNTPSLWSGSGRLWWQLWVSDAMGDIVVAPMLLLWCVHPRMAELRQRRLEIAALLFGILCSGWFIFGRHVNERLLDNSYWLFLFLIWAALRFGPRGVVAASVVVSAIAIAGTMHGYGPFVKESTSGNSLLRLQMFLGIATVTGLILASITVERENVSQDLRLLNDELEQRVIDCTNELAQTNRQMRQKIEENETFVYSVSHDLRSPLGYVQGFSQELTLVGKDLQDLLSNNEVSDAVKRRGLTLINGDMAESIRFIQTGVVRMSSILDSLLRLSRVGRMEYDLQVVDLDSVVARVITSMKGTISERGATITAFDLPPVCGDPNAVEQIFANLIQNALNYLDPDRPGLVQVGCRPAESGTDLERIYFVKDNGLGIADHHRVKLFRAFQRLHPNVAKGEGMGLAIVKRIVECHGGKIWVESTAGVGSTFFVSLPVEASHIKGLRLPKPSTTNLHQREEPNS